MKNQIKQINDFLSELQTGIVDKVKSGTSEHALSMWKKLFGVAIPFYKLQDGIQLSYTLWDGAEFDCGQKLQTVAV